MVGGWMPGARTMSNRCETCRYLMSRQFKPPAGVTVEAIRQAAELLGLAGTETKDQ